MNRILGNVAASSGEHHATDLVPQPPATRDEIAREFKQTPIEMEREVRELVGKCVWDVFSDNHEVIDADQRVVDLGSFRASGEFIAHYLNRCLGFLEYDYIDFLLRNHLDRSAC